MSESENLTAKPGPRAMGTGAMRRIDAWVGVPLCALLTVFRGLGALVRRVPTGPLERILLRVEPSELGATYETVETEARKHLDHRAKLSAYTNPLLVFHAHNDQLVPFSNAERLAAWAAGESKLVGFPAGDHNTILSYNGGAILSEVGRFVETVMAD